jgi:hypothetical protein
MSTVSASIPVAVLWEKYSLDPFTGALYLRKNGNRLLPQKSARSQCAEVYWNGTRVRTNYGRIVFAWCAGQWPVHTVDHRPWNLRDVTQGVNNNNKGAYKCTSRQEGPKPPGASPAGNIGNCFKDGSLCTRAVVSFQHLK